MPYPDDINALDKSSFRRVLRVENLNGEDLRIDGRRNIGHWEWTAISRVFSRKKPKSKRWVLDHGSFFVKDVRNVTNYYFLLIMNIGKLGASYSFVSGEWGTELFTGCW